MDEPKRARDAEEAQDIECEETAEEPELLAVWFEDKIYSGLLDE